MRVLQLIDKADVRTTPWWGEADLEVTDGVGRGKPGGARILLGAERSIEGLGDGAQVECTHGRCCNAVAIKGGTEERQTEGFRITFKKRKIIKKRKSKGYLGWDYINLVPN